MLARAGCHTGGVRRRGITAGCLLAIALAAASLRAQWKTPWDYDGPRGSSHWGSLDPAYAVCQSGRAQSPIDIRSARKADLPALRFAYARTPVEYLTDNGHTLRENYHAPGAEAGTLTVGDRRYRLTQFHFHRPSEEYIEGKPFDMVVHLMHESSDGKAAGVAVLMQAGRPNATIAQLWQHWPAAVGREVAVPGVALDPSSLLPHDLSYYTYMGSLTAPPCDEDVVWYVLKTPIEVSREQIEAFAKRYPGNVRPPQPLNGRVVMESR